MAVIKPRHGSIKQQIKKSDDDLGQAIFIIILLSILAALLV